MRVNTFMNKIKGGIIVSCYAAKEYNFELSEPKCMICLASAVQAGGAVAIRTNLENIKIIRKASSLPIIGIKKVECFKNEIRITPTLKEVAELVKAGADAIAIDGTKRQRLDNLDLFQYINKIKNEFDVIVLADISVLEEAVTVEDAGIDGIDTTLAGYTAYSRNPGGTLGKFPEAPPDYKLISEISKKCNVPVIAEGRFWDPNQVVKAFKHGAHAVVVGTAITNPHKIVERFVNRVHSAI